MTLLTHKWQARSGSIRPMTQNRHNVPDDHTIIGTGYRLLQDDDILQEGDETGLISCLLSFDYYLPWQKISSEDWGEDLGKNIKWICEETGDIDREDRIFRRKINDTKS